MATTTAPATFEWPEFYSFPPFFTLQPVEETRKKQLDMWVSLVVDWCRAVKITEIHTSEADKMEVFANKAISRKLNHDAVTAVLSAVASSGFGVWLSAGNTTLGLASKRVAVIAEDVYAWAESSNLIGTVATVAELSSGEESRSASFYGLAPAVLVAALELLQEDGRAALIPGEAVEETGVKFFARTA